MTPVIDPATEELIGKFKEGVGAEMLRRCQGSPDLQRAFRTGLLGFRLVEEMRVTLDRVKITFDHCVTRTVTINRCLTPVEAFGTWKGDAAVDPRVISTLPMGRDSAAIEEDVQVIFFRIADLVGQQQPGLTTGPKITIPEMARLYDLVGIIPDPRAVVAVNVADPEFSKNYPNHVQWQIPGGQWNCLSFRHVHPHGRDIPVMTTPDPICPVKNWWWAGGILAASAKW